MKIQSGTEPHIIDRGAENGVATNFASFIVQYSLQAHLLPFILPYSPRSMSSSRRKAFCVFFFLFICPCLPKSILTVCNVQVCLLCNMETLCISMEKIADRSSSASGI